MSAPRRLYTLAQLAAAHGMTRSAAQAWARRADFPAPDAMIGPASGWELGTFQAWAREHRPDLLEGRDRR